MVLLSFLNSMHMYAVYRMYARVASQYNLPNHKNQHYLDDFLIVGKPSSAECKIALQKMLHKCKQLGFPIGERKIEGPTSYPLQPKSSQLVVSS